MTDDLYIVIKNDWKGHIFKKDFIKDAHKIDKEITEKVKIYNRYGIRVLVADGTFRDIDFATEQERNEKLGRLKAELNIT